jgi:hypothetical protein
MDLWDEGGPAFPQSNDANKEYNWIRSGMTLRDWFAGQAITGLAADEGERTWSDLAHNAYAMADAMLRIREKES